jgi:hypothetical protein
MHTNPLFWSIASVDTRRLLIYVTYWSPMAEGLALDIIESGIVQLEISL